MKLELFNLELLSFSVTEYIPKLESAFPEAGDHLVNIIFVKSDFIHDLNIKYRNVDSVTDVLSFNIDMDNMLGEVYVCPEYIASVRPEIDLKEETLRLVIHGILHLIGYDHTVELNEETKNTEEMFVKQEKILENVL